MAVVAGNTGQLGAAAALLWLMNGERVDTISMYPETATGMAMASHILAARILPVWNFVI